MRCSGLWLAAAGRSLGSPALVSVDGLCVCGTALWTEGKCESGVQRHTQKPSSPLHDRKYILAPSFSGLRKHLFLDTPFDSEVFVFGVIYWVKSFVALCVSALRTFRDSLLSHTEENQHEICGRRRKRRLSTPGHHKVLVRVYFIFESYLRNFEAVDARRLEAGRRRASTVS